MQLIVRIADGMAQAVHADSQTVAGLYPGCLALPVPDGTAVELGQPWDVDLDAAMAAVCNDIDARAETLRSAVLTPGSGQMAAYQAKEVQARALLADPTPTEGEYPDIFNEIGITADSAGAVAAAVLAAAEKWRTFGRAVERVRLAGKKVVGEAGDVAAVLAARDGLVWPECRHHALSNTAK
ncbi:hypothetical protein [Solidesulfovibrio sp.]